MTKESTVTKPELPMFSSLSFEDAVRLFKSWGFQVEPGPRPEEVTLILDAPDHRTYGVHPASILPQLAAAALRVRFLNGAMYQASSKLRQACQRGLDGTVATLPTGNAPLVLL
jgi:hypothetical protein